RGRMRRHGRAMIAVAVAWAVIVFGILMPWIRQGAVGDTDGYYAWLGGGLNVLSAPFTMTEAVVAALTRSGSWFVVGGMVISLVGLPLLRPRWALLTLPPLAALLLSANSFQAGIRLQYPLILVVPLLVAAALGGRRAVAAADRLRRRRRGHQPERALGARFARPHARRLRPLLPLLLALPAIAGAWVQGSLPPFDLGDPSFSPRPPAIDRLRLVATAVPPSARLLVDEGLVAPLADRSSIGRLAGSTPAPDAYVLIDRLAWSPTWRLERLQAQVVDRLERSADRPILADDGRFVLWGPQTVAGPP
ncbi:MAG: DUF2079 domain-containing protein, partial [Candidatus Limnocylindrales bacterium]